MLLAIKISFLYKIRHLWKGIPSICSLQTLLMSLESQIFAQSNVLHWNQLVQG